jgi:hypothetical protein
MMDQRNMLSLAGITALGPFLLPANAVAQQKSLKEQLIGAWTIVLCEAVSRLRPTLWSARRMTIESTASGSYTHTHTHTRARAAV